MVVKHCSWGKCKSDNRYNDRPEMEGVYFFKFPSRYTDHDRCRKWVKACGRVNFTVDRVTRATFICSKHFIGENGPTTDFPDPVPCSASNTEIAIFSAKKKRPPPRTRISQVRDTHDKNPKAKSMLEYIDITTEHSYFMKEEVSKDIIPEEAIPVDKEIEFPSVEDKERIVKVDMATQTNLCFDDLAPYDDADFKGSNLLKKLFIGKMLEDDKSTKFYTGLNYATLMVLFNFLKSKAEKLKYWQGNANTVETEYEGAAVYKLLGRKGMMLNSSINMDIAEKICDTEASALVCNQFTNLLYGPGLSDADLNRVPVYMSHVPCGTSVRNVVHFAQEVISGQFQLYEFGSAAVNMMHYNQTTPPFVDLKQINVPVALYSGSNDWLADPTDVKFISSNLKKIVEQKEYAKWNHVDFIVGNTAPKTLYVDMLKLMKTYI